MDHFDKARQHADAWLMDMRGYEAVGTVTVPVGKVQLEGELLLPPGVSGLVLFAHGSGSGRASPCDRFVAEALRQRALGTFLFDLLTAQEELQDEIDGHLRFDIPLLGRRLVGATDWVRRHGPTQALPIGYFGASTGAAAALIAAAERPVDVGAVVSRGGLPDLAGDALHRVRAPTLLIVGGKDRAVLRLNRAALRLLAVPKELAIVRGATHLFEEPGALEEVADLAGNWFVRYLQARAATSVATVP
jgi:putative phosphoribosyl transferase